MPLVEQKIGRVCFRGDSRSTLTIFNNGFQPRKPKMGVTFRPSKQDIDPDSAVCVTPRFAVAAFFPGYEGNGPNNQSAALKTQIYAVYLEKGYNTHAHQASNLIGNTVIEKAKDVVYAHELASKNIPAGHVIAAVEVTRNWEARKRWLDETANHTYTVSARVLSNTRYNGPQAYRVAALEYLDEMAQQVNQTFPSKINGYAPVL